MAYLGGSGMGVVHGLSKKIAFTGTVGWHVVPGVSGVYHAGNPRELATGDTASASVRYTDHHGFFSTAVGMRWHSMRRARELQWMGGVALGYGADRIRYKGDETYAYTGEHRQWDEVQRYPFLLARIGGGCSLRLRRMDLTMGLSDTWAWPIGNREWASVQAPFQHSIALTFGSEWRL